MTQNAKRQLMCPFCNEQYLRPVVTLGGSFLCERCGAHLKIKFQHAWVAAVAFVTSGGAIQLAKHVEGVQLGFCSIPFTILAMFFIAVLVLSLLPTKLIPSDEGSLGLRSK